VLAHAHKLLLSTTDGATAFVAGDLRNPEDGLELVEPGVVQVDQWTKDEPPPTPPDGTWVTPLYGAVGRKP